MSDARMVALEARIAALEARVGVEIEPESVLEPYPGPEGAKPTAPFFVPTEPGWYWRLAENGPIVAVVRRDGTHSPLRYLSPWNGAIDVTDDGRWLGPVAPYAHPTRTEAEARARPMRGDRWRSRALQEYTVLDPSRPLWTNGRYRWEPDGALGGGAIAEPGETYLGNFAHELPKDSEP